MRFFTLFCAFLTANLAPAARCPTEIYLQSRKIYGTSLSTNYDFLELAYFDKETYPPMNMRRIEEATWMVVDDQYLEQVTMKKRLDWVRPHKTLVTLPREDLPGASQELLTLIAKALVTHYPQHFERRGSAIFCRLTEETTEVENPTEHPLKVASSLVQEDLLLVETYPDGIPRLVAGSVYFETGWELHERMGWSVSEIHDGVPDFESIDRNVNRLVVALRPDILMARNNWFIEFDSTHARPGDRRYKPPEPRVTWKNAGETLFLRSERETFRRLPIHSNYMLFTIKPHVYPLSEVAVRPQIAARLFRGILVGKPHQNAFPRQSARYLRNAATLAGIDPSAAGTDPTARSAQSSNPGKIVAP